MNANEHESFARDTPSSGANGRNDNAASRLPKVKGAVRSSWLVSFSKAACSGFWNGGPVIWAIGLMPPKQRKPLRLGHRHAWKLINWLRVVEAIAATVVFNRQFEPVFHEIDVALNRAGDDLEFPGELR